MGHPYGSSWFRVSALLALGVMTSLGLGTNAVTAHASGNSQRYKGSESLALVSVAPNPERCGDFPNFEAIFEGMGIDTAGGVFTVTSSACQNVATGLVFDLVATDTYASGDSVEIVADDFYLVFDPQTCVSSNDQPVRYWIDGGTGAFAGASGGGKFDIASNDPSCNGVLAPAFVWFGGKIKP
jgi:hypothetical protein